MYVLTEATKRLADAEKVVASSPVHKRAIELSKIFGTTCYLSESVVDQLMAGKHYFSVGIGTVTLMNYSKFVLDGAMLEWCASKGTRYAKLGKEPVFVHLEIGKRVGQRVNKA